MAVWHGADEVYLGVSGYNARNNIDGFTLDTLQEAVDFAHVYGVKVCLTVNILFADEEMQAAVDLVVAAYDMGVDAFIVQDLGLADLLHRFAPAIPLHASTQMGLHNWEGVEAVLPYGFRRVVLSRETPLAEIARIRANTDVEIEYFVQGALCVSFSGNCYLSERLCDASGNRGKCKQLCRLPYTLVRDGETIKKGYLLSAKDFNMLGRLSDLQKAGVDVLKIEGRARRASYVALSTAVYRRALDGQKVDENDLALAFNRLYTPGYFDGVGDIISPYNNHIGLAVGRVRRVNVGKRFNEVFFSSQRPISPRSALKFFVEGKEQSTVSAFDLTEVDGGYRLTTTQTVSVGAEVRLITDAALEAEAMAYRRRVPVAVSLALEVGRPLTARFVLDREYFVYGEVCQAAIKQPLAQADLAANFDKSEFFEATLTFDAMDAVFLPKRALNEWRRDVYAALYAAMTECYRRDLPSFVLPDCAPTATVADYALVRSWDRLPSAPVVIYSPDDLGEADVCAFAEACRANGVRPYLDVPNFALQEDVAYLRRVVRSAAIGVVANNYFALTLGAADVLVGGGLNIYNRYSAAALGLPVVTTSMPYMTLRHCPMQAHVGGDCSHCLYRDGYVYVMEDGRRLHLRRRRMSSCTFYLEE